ncbi:hypothetical protein IFM89_009172 [Coptis chinensis]|uniref:DUF7651 domain-containing protein n=1 Tax=Coptis chinensis TaxID=261450 RepID=A0A835MEN4_9MAGN|nr:hypothetical protein IFM89_009172 [Coptis chinensis]
MCRQDSQAHSSSENAVAAEESLSIYCKPVELYNILERRAIQNPSFLQRCLRYKIQEKRKRRIKMTISLSSSMIRGAQVQRMLPLYVLLVTPCPEVGAGRRSAAYCCRTEECMLFSSSDFERKDCIKANFVLPEMKTLYDEFKSGKLSVLLISRGVKRNSFLGGNLVSGQMDASSSPVKVGGYCLWGKIPMESLFSSWDKYVSLSTGHGAELFSTVDMRPSFLEIQSVMGYVIRWDVIERNGKRIMILASVA